MSDQAESLRNKLRARAGLIPHASRIITVTSGKGGVGKSNFTLNFALGLQKRGYRVLVFDADIGLANIDVLMGVSPKYHLHHLLRREKTVWEIIQKGYNGLEFIAGGSGFNDLVRLSEAEIDYFAEQIGLLNGYADFILFDTGAGLSKETLKFIVSANETIVVTTPEPTAITDAYAIIKMVHSMDCRVDFRLVVNRITDADEGRYTADKIRYVAKQFLNLDIPVLGYMLDDPNVTKAVKKQIPFTHAFPNSPAARNMERLVDSFLSGQTAAAPESGGIKGFMGKMLKLLK
jgi:flagellar biosynthesis protein FlhG